MVTKIKINDYGDCLYSEDAVIDLIYKNPDIDISNIVVQSDLYNKALKELDIPLPSLGKALKRDETVSNFDAKREDC